eukprot:7217147-Pyramimonas_sp.AAC.1
MAGGVLHASFNHCRLVILPKGNLPQDGMADKRPEDTRPLALSNTDQKLMASCLAYPLKNVVREKLHPVQRGFINGRNMIDNVL